MNQEEHVRLHGTNRVAKPLTYLACPYSHPSWAVRLERFGTANRVAGILMRRGLKVFSPLSHSHPIDEEFHQPEGFDFWVLGQDFAFLDCSNALYVLTVPGWKESHGVTAEIARAKELSLPIHYIDAQGNEVHPE